MIDVASTKFLAINVIFVNKTKDHRAINQLENMDDQNITLPATLL